MEIYQMCMSHDDFLNLADGKKIICEGKKKFRNCDLLLVGDFVDNQYYDRYLIACIDNIINCGKCIKFEIIPISKIIYDVWGFF